MKQFSTKIESQEKTEKSLNQSCKIGLPDDSPKNQDPTSCQLAFTEAFIFDQELPIGLNVMLTIMGDGDGKKKVLLKCQKPFLEHFDLNYASH